MLRSVELVKAAKAEQAAQEAQKVQDAAGKQIPAETKTKRFWFF